MNDELSIEDIDREWLDYLGIEEEEDNEYNV